MRQRDLGSNDGDQKRLFARRRGLPISDSLQTVDEAVDVNIDIHIDVEKAGPAGAQDAMKGQEDVVLRRTEGGLHARP